MAVCDYLKASGIDASRLSQTSPYGAGGPGKFYSNFFSLNIFNVSIGFKGILAGSHRHSWMEAGARGSIMEIPSVHEVDSAASSPGVTRVTVFFKFINDFLFVNNNIK